MLDASLTFLRHWMSEPKRYAALVVSHLEKNGFHPTVVEYAAHEPIVREGSHNEFIYLLLEGSVNLSKTSESGQKITIAELRPGSLVGLVSFVSRRLALTSATAAEPCRLVRMDREEFDLYSTHSAELSRLSMNLILGNMLDRYDQVLSLQVEMERLNSALEVERDQLRTTLQQLGEAQRRLVSQERMALLGQLVSGVAHEINNPAAALLRAAEQLSQELPALCRQEGGEEAAELFEHGLQRAPIDTARQRDTMAQLEERLPDLSRPVLRLMSQLQDAPLQALMEIIDPQEEATDRSALAMRYLSWFEAGAQLKNVQTASSRIANLVQSLKSYSRPRGRTERVDLREGLRDTLTLFKSKLQNIELILDLPDIPKVQCNSAEINQIWTNIISNAHEAMGGRGKLQIFCGHDEDGVFVVIEDFGPGIKDELKTKIFQLNFTTKHTDTEFGLGLGLAISSEILRKNGGTITLEDAHGHSGARFVVRFPIA